MHVEPAFFTTKGNWNLSLEVYPSIQAQDSLTRLQDTVLDGKYLDRTVFDMLSAAGCVSRYNADFVTSGTGFVVPTAEWRKVNERYLKAGLYYSLVEGSGNFFPHQDHLQLECESPPPVDMQILIVQRLLESEGTATLQCTV
jgi:hypothetical protein